MQVGLWLTMGMLVLARPALAEGMRIEPGKWELRSTNQQATGETRSDVRTMCFENAEMTPQVFMKDTSDCTTSDTKSDESSMSWKMTCASTGGSMSADASFTSGGSTMQGVMKMRIDVAGQQLTFDRLWEGKRVGMCD
jgi:hypothetical protein